MFYLHENAVAQVQLTKIWRVSYGAYEKRQLLIQALYYPITLLPLIRL